MLACSPPNRSSARTRSCDHSIDNARHRYDPTLRRAATRLTLISYFTGQKGAAVDHVTHFRKGVQLGSRDPRDRR
jgi:hypothetical protein